VMVTADKNLQYQQNFARRRLALTCAGNQPLAGRSSQRGERAAGRASR
jgi:hypothetical protein